MNSARLEWVMKPVNVFHTNLCEVIDSVDAMGVYRFVDLKRYRFEKLAKAKSDAVRSMIERRFVAYPLFVNGLGGARRRILGIDALDGSHEADNGDWHIEFDLAKFLFLPGVRPAQELVELRAFLEATKPFFLANSQRTCDVQFVNERASDRSVIGELSCRVCDTDDADQTAESSVKMLADPDHTDRLRAMVEASDTLKFFVKQIGCALQKSGTWSWFCLREDHVFGEHSGPRALAVRDRVEQSPSAQPASPGRDRQR